MERSFSQTLSALRKERNISQRQAAAELNISQALLSHYENGAREPGLNFVCRACDYYGVSADYLLGRSDKADRKKKKEGRNTGLLILTIICAVFAAPILIPLIIALFAVVFSLAAAAVVIAAAFMIAGIVCIVAGLAALVVAIAKFAVVPAGAMVAAGICLMVIGIGILLVLLMGWILVRWIPAVCRGCVHLISRLFHRKPKGGHE